MGDQSGARSFTTLEGVPIPAVTAQQMKRVDDLAENRYHLSVLQMMENAGRNLVQLIWPRLDSHQDRVAVLAGSGGNGGGGLAAARHLHNRRVDVDVILSRQESALSGPAQSQLAVLREAGVPVLQGSTVEQAIASAKVVVDALIGYSLQGSPRGRISELIELCNQYAGFVISLDIPSGLDATSGHTNGVWISPQQILTLALPKTGLVNLTCELFLADIGIPPQLYHHLDLVVPAVFESEYIIPIRSI